LRGPQLLFVRTRGHALQMIEKPCYRARCCLLRRFTIDAWSSKHQRCDW